MKEEVNTIHNLESGHESLASHIIKGSRTSGVQYNKHSFKTTQYHNLCFNFAQRFAVKRSYFINFYKFFPNVPVCCQKNNLYFNLKS